MSKWSFSTDYKEIVSLIDTIEPVAYAKSRNYLDGSVTRLSPYVSRGIVSTKQVVESIIKRGFSFEDSETLLRELAWRDYFQRLWQVKNVDVDLKSPQQNTQFLHMPKAVFNASTGITALDVSLKELYETGYMHNHSRMYVASAVTNIAQTHWLQPARWMYYHLLDSDWASNACSWQWVAGCNSSKKYFANQENINRYSHTSDQNTFLDVPYEALENVAIPEILTNRVSLDLKTKLPESVEIGIDSSLPTLIYNFYNLDPLWHKDFAANRVLLLEPSVFERYPVGEKSINFALDLAKNIPEIEIFVGEFSALKSKTNQTIYFKEHTLNAHYEGLSEPRDWIVDSVSGYFPSFFAYWKKIEPLVKKLFTKP